MECIYFKLFWGNMHKWNPLSNATQIPSSKLHCQNSNFVQNPRKAFTNVFTFLSLHSSRIKLIFRSINFHILTPNIYQALGAFYVCILLCSSFFRLTWNFGAQPPITAGYWEKNPALDYVPEWNYARVPQFQKKYNTCNVILNNGYVLAI